MSAYYVVGWSHHPEIRSEGIRISDKTDSHVRACKYCFGCCDNYMTTVRTTRVIDLQTDKRRLALIEQLRRKHRARFASGELEENR